MQYDDSITQNFKLSELIQSATAQRLKLNNEPSGEVRGNLIVLTKHLLQPLRERIQKPITITSGYRCSALNRAVGSNDNSQHVKGQAADIIVRDMTAESLFTTISNSGLLFDQLILEFYNKSNPYSGWVHVSFVNANRQQVMKIGGSDGN